MKAIIAVNSMGLHSAFYKFQLLKKERKMEHLFVLKIQKKH